MFSVHHQVFFTVHTATVYVIQVLLTACEQEQDGTAVSITCMIPNDGDMNCPKHVEFHSKNKFEKLVHLLGFMKLIQKVRTISL